jgi:tRNA threonylcarbamoyladenosine biosynthesis protein TsaE
MFISLSRTDIMQPTRTTFTSHSPRETEAAGEIIGRAARPGWVIGVGGELGAGKTELVKGVARALGVTDRVHSPTFALVHEYRGGRWPLFHLDLFRLDTPEQIIRAGLAEYWQPAGVSVIEWAERWTGWMPDDYRRVFIEVTGDTERRIAYDHPGA